jgi:predicted RNA-binding protein YlxR (DUF448 family)
MVAKKTRKRKHVPQRTCVGCHKVENKREMIRIVRKPNGIEIDPTGKIAGRGAYLHKSKSCWERGMKSAIAHALKIELTQEDIQTLLDYMDNIPETVSNQI